VVNISEMDGFKRWRDTDHLRRAVESAECAEAFDAAVWQMSERCDEPTRAIPRSTSSYARWCDVRAEQVCRAGGEEAVAAGKAELLAHALTTGTLPRSLEGAGHYEGDG
jgi:hypothetical protein